MATPGSIVDQPEAEGSQNSVDIDSLARFAIRDHQKTVNIMMEFEKVISTRTQVVAGVMYYITMEVKVGVEKKLYEATVWVKPWMDFKKVQEFKLIGDA